MDRITNIVMGVTIVVVGGILLAAARFFADETVRLAKLVYSPLLAAGRPDWLRSYGRFQIRAAEVGNIWFFRVGAALVIVVGLWTALVLR